MTRLIQRRTVLWSCLSLLAAACSSRWQASNRSGGKYLDLKQAVTFPLASITERWHALTFEAWVSPSDDTEADKLLKGILLRTEERKSSLKAFCVICPHEVCEVQYLKETEMIPLEAVVLPDHPVLSCPCHFSVFDPLQDGAVINGPALRGLYRFRLTTRGSTVRITQVEEEVLTLFT